MKYNKNGNEASENDTVFAECVDGSVQKVYYVLTHNNALYDPLGTDAHRENSINKKLKTTSKQTFDYYLHYLKDKNRIYITRAQRSFIDG
tara:strand:+ start:3282 stop:3551 length:270 start_codon:yes stop_codon:yes gene_type:complete